MKILNCQLLGEMCEFLLEGEPVFVIRAQDKAASGALTGYLAESLRLGGRNLNRTKACQARIEKWQLENPNRVKPAD
jgi:hypothetical protein